MTMGGAATVSAPDALPRPFWRFLLGAALSAVADGIRLVGFPLLVASMTSDSRLIAAVTAANLLPWALFGLAAGVVADRCDRRRVMVYANLSRVAALLAFAGALALLGNSVVLVIIFSFVLGAAQTVSDSAGAALIPMLSPWTLLERANRLFYTLQSIMLTVVGALVAGVLVRYDAGAVVGVLLLAYGGAAAALSAFAGRYRVTRDRTASPLGDVAAGLRWLWKARALRTLALLLGWMNVTFAAAQALVVVYALQVLGLDETAYTVLLSASALGSLFILPLLPFLQTRLSPRTMVSLLAGGQVVAFVAVGLSSGLAVAAGALTLVGAVTLGWNIAVATLRQRLTPPELLGRVTSVFRVLGLSVMPVGAYCGGLLAHAVGTQNALLVAGLVLLLAMAVLVPALPTAAGTNVASCHDVAGHGAMVEARMAEPE